MVVRGMSSSHCLLFFFFQAEDGIRDYKVTGVQTCALPIWFGRATAARFLAGGAQVGVNVRTQQRAELAAKELGAGAFPLGGDIREASTEIGRASCRERV